MLRTYRFDYLQTGHSYALSPLSWSMAPERWKNDLEALVESIVVASPAEFPGLARKMHGLLCMGPTEVAAALGMPCPADRLERLLTANALSDIGFALIGRADYLLSRGENGTMATVSVSNLFPPTDATGRDAPMALTTALAIGLRDYARTLAILTRSKAIH